MFTSQFYSYEQNKFALFIETKNSSLFNYLDLHLSIINFVFKKNIFIQKNQQLMFVNSMYILKWIEILRSCFIIEANFLKSLISLIANVNAYLLTLITYSSNLYSHVFVVFFLLLGTIDMLRASEYTDSDEFLNRKLVSLENKRDHLLLDTDLFYLEKLTESLSILFHIKVK